MKIIAWNVNGIRAMLKKKDLIDLINDENPDIFCMSEIKTSNKHDDIEDEIHKKLKCKYHIYWNSSKIKGGYSGTAILTKKEPSKVIYGLCTEDKDKDEEGRVITCEYSKFYIVHVYTPNSGELLKRLEYRTKTWDSAFIKYINKLQENKKVIVCGDLNVAHKEIDLKNPKSNLRSAGFTIEERESFDILLQKTELVDSFRYLYPETIKYSYWSYRQKARERNSGWRIDYFLLPKLFLKKINKIDILTDIYGSDHAPIILEINIK